MKGMQLLRGGRTAYRWRRTGFSDELSRRTKKICRALSREFPYVIQEG